MAPFALYAFDAGHSRTNLLRLGQPFDVFKALWADPSLENKTAFAQLVDFEFTKKQYNFGGSFFLDRPGNSAIQLTPGYDYRYNLSIELLVNIIPYSNTIHITRTFVCEYSDEYLWNDHFSRKTK